jgi:hypothetical protein
MRKQVIELLNGVDNPDPPWIKKMGEINCGNRWNQERMFELAKNSPKALGLAN